MIVVIFSALISVVLAADPQRCSCGPNKYMATIMTLAADSSLSKPGDSSTKTETMMLNYDYDMKRMAVFVNSYEVNTGRETNTTVVYEYNNNTAYIIPQTGGCYLQNLLPNSMLSPCIPDRFVSDLFGNHIVGFPTRRLILFFTDNSTYEGRFKIGGMMSANIDRWSSPFGNGLLTIFVTADDCSIVSQVFMGQNEDNSRGMITAELFVDLMRDMVDPMAFDIPAACNAAPQLPIGIGKRAIEKLQGLGFHHTL